MPRFAWVATTALVGVLAMFMLQDRFGPAQAAGPWNDYLRISLAPNSEIELTEEAELEHLEQLAVHLERTLSFAPNYARANLRYAANCLRRFEIVQTKSLNPMALSQIRDAALASRFGSKEAQDAWLAVAIGENRELLDRALYHTRLSLARSPLQGDGYIYLTSLSFLEGPRQEAKREYIAQAQLVRPHSGTVLFAAGQEAALLGEFDMAVEHWRRAFHQDMDIRSLIVETFAPLVPVNFLLDAFEPELGGLATIYHYYERSQRPADARTVGLKYGPALEQAAESAQQELSSIYWDRAHKVYASLELPEQSLVCQSRAVDLDSRNFAKRRALGVAFRRCGRFDEAAEQFQWCANRRPDDTKILQELAAAKRDSILRQSSVAGPGASPAERKRR
jgi:tetratricopeptide (TPR) repeat protein